MKSWRFVFGCVLLVAAAAAVGAWLVAAEIPVGKTEILIGRSGAKARIVVVNFGRIYHSQTLTRRLILRNISRRTLSLRVQTSCGCTRVRIANPIIRPGGSSVVEITYAPFSEGVNGPTRQEFLIYSSSGKAAVAQLQGTVEAFLLGALHFNRSAVHWIFIPGKFIPAPHFVTAENVSTYPIKVRWRGGGAASFFSVTPVLAEIMPGESEKFIFRPAKDLGLHERTNTATATLSAWVRSDKGLVPLQSRFQVYSAPEPVLQAIPGSLVLSAAGYSHHISDVIRLVSVSGIAHPPRVLTITTTSPHTLKATLKGKVIRISLHLAPGEKLFQGDIVVVFSHDDFKQRIDIPVFVAPNIAGS